MGFESISRQSNPADYPPKTPATPDSEERRRDTLKRKKVSLILSGLKSEYMKKTGKDSLSQEELDALRGQAMKREELLDRSYLDEEDPESESLESGQNAKIMDAYRKSSGGESVREAAIGIGANSRDTAEAIRLADIERRNATLQPGETADDVARKFLEENGLGR